MLRLLTALATIGLLATTAGCFDPCDRLADKICECEDNDYQRETCRQRVELQKENRDPTDANRAACEAALETCTCAALDRMELSACGFAR